MRIYLSSLGCKLNQSEMDDLAVRLGQAGHQVVAASHEADLCVLNTCAVTHVAAQKSRQALRRLHRDRPEARLVVTGCYAELTPADLRDLPGVELVVGNQAKDSLLEILDNRVSPHRNAPGQPDAWDAGCEPALAAQPRTRALVKIQDGCDNACTYCVIHLARGPQRSRPAEQVLAEVKARRAAGYQEVVLTGVHLGAYGRDRQPASGPAADLWQLAARVLSETDLPRLRLSSIEPWDLPERALRLWDDPRLCPHLHLPLQSGCDATLRRMGRHYTSAQFAALLETAQAAIPDLAVTTDVIVGFPGETEQEFAVSLDFVRASRFARVHVFPYSRRPGTPAAAMPGQVLPQVKAERAQAMRSAGLATALAFRQRFVGRTFEVLWEAGQPGAGGRTWSGLTGNYLRVHTVSAAPLVNRRTKTRLLALRDDGLWGQIEE